MFIPLTNSLRRLAPLRSREALDGRKVPLLQLKSLPHFFIKLIFLQPGRRQAVALIGNILKKIDIFRINSLNLAMTGKFILHTGGHFSQMIQEKYSMSSN